MTKQKVLTELKNLFSEVDGVNLSEEKLDVIAKVLETLAEGMVAEKLEENIKLQEAQKTEELREFINKAITSIDETLDEYVEEFFSDNRKLLKRAVINTNLTEMVRKVRGVVANYGIDIPSNRKAMNESHSRISELRSDLNKKTARVRKLKEANMELVKHLVIQEMTKGLTASERDRIETLAENVAWETPIQLKEKVEKKVNELPSKDMREAYIMFALFHLAVEYKHYKK
jgi:hypothetical protein